MTNTVSVDIKTLQHILTRLDNLTREVVQIKEKLFEKEAPYGSDDWWNKEIKNADKNFKAGKGIRFNSIKDATRWLNS